MKPQRLFGALLGPLVAIALIALRLADPAPVASLRQSGFDFLQHLWPRVSAPQPVRIADIDEASLKAIGQWPWPRDKLAALTTNLKNLGAAAIVFDIVFPEPDRLSPASLMSQPDVAKALQLVPGAAVPDNDKLFADAIAQAPVVLAQSSTTDAGSTAIYIAKAGFAQTGLDASGAPPLAVQIVSNLPQLDQAAKGLGLINIDLAGNGGVARQVPLVWSGPKMFYPSLELEALGVAQNTQSYVLNNSPNVSNAINSVGVGPIEIPTDEQGQMIVYYAADDPGLSISAAKLMDPQTAESFRPQIENNIVLIGTSATGLLDTRVSALGEAIPGVAVHAQALQQILSGQFLHRPQWAEALELSAILATALFFAAASLWARPALLLGVLVAAFAMVIGATVYAFRLRGLLLDASFPILAIAASFAATLAFKLLVSDAQGRSLRRAFSHYISAPLLAEIERQPEKLKLGGEQREVTVLFADIKNFTPLTQKLSAQELVSFVNTILSAATEAVLSESGTLDKYIGDAVMAFWNAPVTVADHQYRACLAALKIQDAVARLNEDESFSAPLKAKGLWPIGVRIGLASGPAAVGNMGSATRFDYSVLGETVNLAARAETACKHVEADIVLAGKLEGASLNLAALEAGSLALKGLDGKITCHAVFAAAQDDNFIVAKKAFSTKGKRPPLQAPYERFFTGLAARKADYR